MKLYFLRHALTAVNLTGTMVQNYEQEPIVGTMPEHWQEDIGQYLPKIDINTPVISSPAKRCQQTAELLFKNPPMLILDELKEFDCGGLNNLKFWEITKEEFENVVLLKPEDMERQIDLIFKFFYSMHGAFPNIDNIVCISHGMVIRYIYHYLTGNKGISAYDVINSNGFKFYNLDLLVYDTVTKEIKDYHNDVHITRF